MSEGSTGAWYYQELGATVGPVPEAALRERVRDGSVAPHTLVWSEGMAVWEPVAAVFPESQAQSSAEPTIQPAAVFFPVTVAKFAVMSVVTLGLYDLYWAFRAWDYVKRTEKIMIRPFWRAWFSLFFTYSLLKRIRVVLGKEGERGDFSPGWLTAGYVVASLLSRAPWPFAAVSLLAWAFLIPVVDAIDDINRQRLDESQLNGHFTGWNIFGIVVGVLFWGLVVWGLTVPSA